MISNLRVAFAQIDYHPAYILPTGNLLTEPKGESINWGVINSIPRIKIAHHHIYEKYIQNLSAKVAEIINTCIVYKANLK